MPPDFSLSDKIILQFGGSGHLGRALSTALHGAGATVVVAGRSPPASDAAPIAHERVEKVSDYLKEGQIIRVKVMETDEKGRVKLSMKALLDRPGQQGDQG